MKKRLLFCSMLGVLSGCSREADISPTTSPLAVEVAGIYRTNFYLDPSSVATPGNQLSYAELKAESDSSVTLVYSRDNRTQSIQHVVLERKPDGIYLRTTNSRIGTLKIDRVFTNNGMEKQGQLLRIVLPTDSVGTLNFSGIRE